MQLRNLKEKTKNLPKSDQVVSQVWLQNKIKGITSTSVVVSIKQLRGRQFPTNPLGPIKEIMKNDQKK